MPVDRSVRLSVPMFCELLGIEPSRFVDIEIDKLKRIVTVVQEPMEEPLPAAFRMQQFSQTLGEVANERAWQSLSETLKTCKAGPPVIEAQHGPDPTGHP